MAAKKPRPKQRGQILPRGPQKWLVRCYAGKAGDGTKIYPSKSVDGTFATAQKALTALLAENDRNPNVAPDRITMEEFWPDWLASKRGIAASTRSQYEERGASDILPHFGKMLLKDVSPLIVARWIATLEEKGHSPRTIQYSFTLLHATMKLAFRRQLVSSIPTADCELPAQANKEMAVLSPAEIRTFLDATAGDPLSALWYVLLTGGLRPQEAVVLEVTDFAGDVLSVNKALTEDAEGRAVVGPTKTAKSRRTVALPTEAADILRAVVRQQGIIAGRIFRNEAGGLLDLSKVRKEWKKACTKAGVPQVRLYDARHSHLTALLAAGVPLKIAQERAGHSSIKVTGDVYSHVLPEMASVAADAMQALLQQAPASAQAR